MSRVDKTTQKWIRNVADEKAVANGCRFDEERGMFVIQWAESNLVLWEGEAAGQPLIAVDWQYDCTMRLFGWVRDSERWGRKIRRFRECLVGKPKKQKKSPTVAWWMLFLLDGDGEPGQNCYTAAKDGQQARIVQEHAVKMVQSSPTLSQYMRINKTDYSITVDETNSKMKILSSDNVNSQKSKEGLNGSCSVDEVHVVDEAFMRRITRMGISRSEPMINQVTTAGDDPLSYGRKRYEYGVRVNSGAFENESFFFDWHEVPQDLTPDALAADPIKYGKMANPSWGHTVGEEEYLADYRGCDTPSSIRDFMMYRLNVWQESANPWLVADDWKQCHKTISDDRLKELPCWAGLDLSRTRDMTSVALAFLDGSTIHYRWYWWLPEETARARSKVATFADWAEDPRVNLTLTAGNVIDYDYVWQTLVDIGETYQLQKLVFDPRFADYLIQRLQTGDPDGQGGYRIKPATYAIESMAQTTTELFEPIEEFEKLVVSHSLGHNGDPIAAWQAGNVKRGRNGLLEKPHGKDDVRTIDGIQAAVMALNAVEHGAVTSAYDIAGAGSILL